jgi:hypothetical protein
MKLFFSFEHVNLLITVILFLLIKIEPTDINYVLIDCDRSVTTQQSGIFL